MIDFARLRPGVTRVKLSDGQVGQLRGSYMTEGGIAFTVKMTPNSIVDRNVLWSDIVEIVEPAEKLET